MLRTTDTEKAGWAALQKARAYVKKELPYFYKTLIGLIPQSVPGIGTLFVTERWVMGVDLEWFATLDTDVAGGCLIHECMHVLRDIGRIKALPDQKLAPYAFDIPINDDLKKFGIKLPKWVVYSTSHDLPPGLTGEMYYELLSKQKVKLPSKLGAGSCGSCAGKPHELEEKIKEIDTKFGRDQKDIKYLKTQGVSDIRQFLKGKGVSAGTASGTWREFLEFDNEKPIIPWQRMVKTKALNAIGRVVKGQSDYSLRHPAKRSYTLKFLRPGLVNMLCEAPSLIIEDASASMQAGMVKTGRIELLSAMEQLGITHTWFMNADTQVTVAPKLISIKDLKTLPVVGRGGTAFGPAIEAAMKMKPRPKIIFYSTDGGANDRDKIQQPRGVEFIWLLVPSSYTCKPCSWGTQILMSNDRDERKKFEMLK